MAVSVERRLNLVQSMARRQNRKVFIVQKRKIDVIDGKTGSFDKWLRSISCDLRF